jgi:hypothetical protein
MDIDLLYHINRELDFVLEFYAFVCVKFKILKAM